MIFQHTHEKVMSGQKTQTRRVLPKNFIAAGGHGFAMIRGFFEDSADWEPRLSVLDIATIGTYTKWSVNRTYAVQPGRGKKAVGRMRVTELRIECLQTITHEDAIAEGVSSVEEYRALWDKIHGKTPGARWDDNPLVVVFTFEVVQP